MNVSVKIKLLILPVALCAVLACYSDVFAISKIGKKRAVVALDEAVAFLEANDFDKALEKIDESLKIYPRFARAHVVMGKVFYRKGNTVRALVEFEKAIELDPSEDRAYWERGQVYYDTRDYKRAVADFGSVIEHNNKDYKAFYHRGLAYMKLGNVSLAVKDFEFSLKIDDEYAESHFGLAVIYKKRGSKDQEDYHRGKASEFFNKRGREYLEIGDYKSAISAFKSAIRANEKDSQGYYNIAAVEAAQGKAESFCKKLSIAVRKGFEDWDLVYEDKAIDKIRGEHCFSAIVDAGILKSKNRR